MGKTVTYQAITVHIELELDGSYPHPRKWDWGELLDLPPDTYHVHITTE